MRGAGKQSFEGAAERDRARAGSITFTKAHLARRLGTRDRCAHGADIENHTLSTRETVRGRDAEGHDVRNDYEADFARSRDHQWSRAVQRG